MSIPSASVRDARIHSFLLQDNGSIPNNSRLPLLIYEGAFREGGGDLGSNIQSVLQEHGWGGIWKNGIYTFHHYHGTAHEFLGVCAGEALVQFGGEQGIARRLQPGDAVLIPAGVGHKCLQASEDFAVIGAYPDGQSWDMCYGKPEERDRALQSIVRVPFPKLDPIYGSSGPVFDRWRHSNPSA